MFRRKLAIPVICLAAAAFGGGAYAATQGSATNDKQAFLNDVAQRLKVSPQQLRSALQGALLDRLQQAVKDGRLTQAQADAIKQRILQGGPLPLWFGGFQRPGGPGFGHRGLMGPRGGLHAAAAYLGLSDMQLFQQLGSGKSLAQIAQSRGKSVQGLKQAMLDSVHKRLDQAVKDKRITNAQEQQILSRLSSALDAMINHSPPRFPPSPGGPGGPGGAFGHWHDGDSDRGSAGGAPGTDGPPGPPPGPGGPVY